MFIINKTYTHVKVEKIYIDQNIWCWQLRTRAVIIKVLYFLPNKILGRKTRKSWVQAKAAIGLGTKRLF